MASQWWQWLNVLVSNKVKGTIHVTWFVNNYFFLLYSISFENVEFFSLYYEVYCLLLVWHWQYSLLHEEKRIVDQRSFGSSWVPWMNIAKVFVSQCKGGGSDKIDQSRNTKVADIEGTPLRSHHRSKTANIRNWGTLVTSPLHNKYPSAPEFVRGDRVSVSTNESTGLVTIDQSQAWKWLMRVTASGMKWERTPGECMQHDREQGSIAQDTDPNT